MFAELRLLPQDALIRTGPVDHADWNYRPVLATISRARLRMVRSLLPHGPVNRLLEVGYGSGVFLPELAARCRELHGLDPHPHAAEVTARLTAVGIAADLRSGSAEAMPYPDGYFDRIVAVSSLEFVPDIAAAAAELRRVLAPGGAVVAVTPGFSPVVDFGLKLLTGESAKKDYGDRRERLLPALTAHFAVRRRRVFPPVIGHAVRLYEAVELA